MKYFVTGSSGFIGSHLIKVLDEAVPYDLAINRDIRDVKMLKELMKGCDVVIHLAALCNTTECWEDPTKYYDVNVVGTSKVIETAIELGIKKIVFASSATIYAPVYSPYGISKVMCESILKLRQSKISSTAFRFMNVYGKGQNSSYGMVIPNFIKGIKEGKIRLDGDGKQTRDFIHVDDVCRMLKMAAEKESKGFIAMDLGTGKSYSIEELAYILMGMMGKKPKVEYAPERVEAKHAVANIKPIEEIFGFKPEVDLVTGLRRLLDEGV